MDDLLNLIGASTVGTVFSGPVSPGTVNPELTGAILPNDVNPVEHFERRRTALTESDNLFGPRSVIPVAKEQLGIMQNIGRQIEGADRLNLIRVQAQYAEFVGWLYQDLGDFKAARQWTDRALELANITSKQELIAVVRTWVRATDELHCHGKSL